jgi:hypothetical protein
MLHHLQQCALWLALHSTEGAADRWRTFIGTGKPTNDAALTAQIGEEFGIMGGFGGPGLQVEYHGGQNPRCEMTRYTLEADGSRTTLTAVTFKGRDLLTAARKVLCKPPADPFGSLHPKGTSETLTPQGEQNQSPATNHQSHPDPMTRIPTFGGTPAAPTPEAKPRDAKRFTRKAKCVKPDAKTKANGAAHTAHSASGAARPAQAGKRHTTPKGTTAKLIRETDAAFFAALAPGKDGDTVRTSFASYATEHNLDGHWRLHWNAYLAFRATLTEAPTPPPNFDHDPRFDEGGEHHAAANPIPAHFKGLKPGERVTFTPHAEHCFEVDGIVQDNVNPIAGTADCYKGVNIFCPLDRDPHRVLRVWASDGAIRQIAIGEGTQFRTDRHDCTWTVLHYHRGGNWVCQEPGHQTTCHFHETEILAGKIDAPESPESPASEPAESLRALGI